MSAVAGAVAYERLTALREAKDRLKEAECEHSDSYVRYIRDALAANWPWTRIAKPLDITPSAVRRYWKAHRHRAGRLG